MTSPKYDLVYLEAAVDSLNEFLLVEDLFWPIGVNPPGGEPPFPRLTIGGLLLSRERLNARQLPFEQEAKLTKISSQMDVITSEWQSAWESKATRSYQMRLKMWRDFIEEYRSQPESNADRYSYEVRLRVMLHLLNNEIGDTELAEQDLLAGLDLILRAIFVSGEFIWEADLSHGFSQGEYWYLYGKLPEEL